MAMKKLNSSQRVEETRVEFNEKGDSVQGYYIGSEGFTSKDGDELTKHRLKADDGEILGVLGNKVINDEMVKVKIGERVIITFEGWVQGKKRRYRNFTVERDDEDVLAS